MPETFVCGVEIVGPSSLETLLATIPPCLEPLVKIFPERMGDPTTEEGRKRPDRRGGRARQKSGASGGALICPADKPVSPH
jgi:hypothetical protein